ncbi:MAG: hypothetical protein ACI9PP_000600 [Halobacteriales archaeon]|jgi:hypothetical protein
MTFDCSLSSDVREDSVAFTFEVTNQDDAPVELQFSDGQESDLVIEDADGTEVWRWSAGRMFTQMLQQKQLIPDGTLTYEFEWDAPDPGEYEATATLAAMNQDCEATTTFEV